MQILGVAERNKNGKISVSFPGHILRPGISQNAFLWKPFRKLTSRPWRKWSSHFQQSERNLLWDMLASLQTIPCLVLGLLNFSCGPYSWIHTIEMVVAPIGITQFNYHNRQQISFLGKGSKIIFKKNIWNFPNRGGGVLRGVNFQ